MKRTWKNVERLAPLKMKMGSAGLTIQQIADALGLKKIQAKNWINRHNIVPLIDTAYNDSIYITILRMCRQ